MYRHKESSDVVCSLLTVISVVLSSIEGEIYGKQQFPLCFQYWIFDIEGSEIGKKRCLKRSWIWLCYWTYAEVMMNSAGHKFNDLGFSWMWTKMHFLKLLLCNICVSVGLTISITKLIALNEPRIGDESLQIVYCIQIVYKLYIVYNCIQTVLLQTCILVYLLLSSSLFMLKTSYVR